MTAPIAWDAANKPIHDGDIVFYAVTVGQSAHARFGIVVEEPTDRNVSLVGFNVFGDQNPRNVAPIRRTKIWSGHRVIALTPDQAPQEVREAMVAVYEKYRKSRPYWAL